jgi:hypothetical protein
VGTFALTRHSGSIKSMGEFAVGVKIDGVDTDRTWVFEADEELETGANVSVLSGGFGGYTGKVVSLGRGGYTGPCAAVERFPRYRAPEEIAQADYLPPGDPCPQRGEADLERRGGKHICPLCHFCQPCCQP